MRKLIASTFTSLDGVMQAPGGPTEDPTGNFTLGGWLFAFGDAEMDLSAQVSMVKIESLYWVAKPTKYSRHIGLTNQRITRLRGRSMRQKSMWRPAL